MPQQYLLPCSCGQSVTVETGQAGDAVTCTCGNRLEVPTFRQLTKLPPADGPVAASPTGRTSSGNWGARQGLLLLGGVMLLATLGATLYIWSDSPRSLADHVADERRAAFDLAQIDNMTPNDAWRFWKVDILEGRFDATVQKEVFADRHGAELHQRKYWVAVFVAVIGLLVLIAGLCWQKPRPIAE